MNTEYESQIFELMEKLCPVFDDNGNYDHFEVQINFYNGIENFEKEVINNCTILDYEREKKYLNRLKNRLHKVVEAIKAEDPEKGTTENLGIKLFIPDKNKTIFLEPEEVKSYYVLVKQCKHELLSYINELESTQLSKQPAKNKKPQNEIESLIHQHFENMHEKGWSYAFITKEDYNYFVDLLSKDLHNEEYKLPSTEITLKRRTKTGIGRVLGELHKYKGEKLRTDENFFNLIRILEPFKDESNQGLEKILTR